MGLSSKCGPGKCRFIAKEQVGLGNHWSNIMLRGDHGKTNLTVLLRKAGQAHRTSPGGWRGWGAPSDLEGGGFWLNWLRAVLARGQCGDERGNPKVSGASEGRVQESPSLTKERIFVRRQKHGRDSHKHVQVPCRACSHPCAMCLGKTGQVDGPTALAEFPRETASVYLHTLVSSGSLGDVAVYKGRSQAKEGFMLLHHLSFITAWAFPTYCLGITEW